MKRDAERDEIAGWYAADDPDEGSLLIMMPLLADVKDVQHAAFERLEYDPAHCTPAEVISARKSWEFRSGMITIWEADGSKRETREPTDIELDLIEEVTALWRAEAFTY